MVCSGSMSTYALTVRELIHNVRDARTHLKLLLLEGLDRDLHDVIVDSSALEYKYYRPIKMKSRLVCVPRE